MLQSILHETKYVQDVYSEYLNFINRYQNLNRQGVFLKYYNIDLIESTYEKNIESTYDIYNISDIKFNLYEMCPAFFIQPLVNRVNNVSDVKGQFFDATSSVVLYTIKTPQINDLITFYNPVKSDEILRVNSISVATNSFYSPANLKWFELELEYAPVKIENIKIREKYIYDLSLEKYIYYDTYVSKLSLFNNIIKKLDLLSIYYNSRYDIYKLNNIVPNILNEIFIYLKKNYSNNFNRILDKYLLPYGYESLNNVNLINNLLDIKKQNIIPYSLEYIYYDFNTKEKNRYVYKTGNIDFDNVIDIIVEIIDLIIKNEELFK